MQVNCMGQRWGKECKQSWASWHWSHHKSNFCMFCKGSLVDHFGPKHPFQVSNVQRFCTLSKSTFCKSVQKVDKKWTLKSTFCPLLSKTVQKVDIDVDFLSTFCPLLQKVDFGSLCMCASLVWFWWCGQCVVLCLYDWKHSPGAAIWAKIVRSDGGISTRSKSR